MSESIFLTYFWSVPALWIALFILNRILGYYIDTVNSKNDSQSYTEKIDFIFLLRVFLFFPVIILTWWFLTQIFSLTEVYLLIAGYALLAWVTAIVKQVSSLLFANLLQIFKYQDVQTTEKIKQDKTVVHIGSAVEYFGYALIYLLVFLLTKSYFFAGGLLACTFSIFRNLINAKRNQYATGEQQKI